MRGVIAERQAVQVVVDADAQVVCDPLADALREIVVDGETGRLCRAGDAANLADVLSELAKNSSQRLRLGKAARSWVVKNRSWAATAATLNTVYGQFC